MFAEQPGERGWAWHPPAFSFSAVLETAAVAFGSFIGPLLPGVGSCGPQVELAPLTARFDPIPTGVVPFQIRQHNVPAAEADSLLGTKPAVVENTEERDQSGATGFLSPHGF